MVARVVAVLMLVGMVLCGCDDTDTEQTPTEVVWHGTVKTSSPPGSLDIAITFSVHSSAPDTYCVYAAGTWGSGGSPITAGVVSVNDSGEAEFVEDAAYGTGVLAGTCCLNWDDNVGSVTITGLDSVGTHLPLTGPLTRY